MFKRNSALPPARQRSVETPQRSQVFSYHASRSAHDTNVGREVGIEEKQKLRRNTRLAWWRTTPRIVAAILIVLLLIMSASLNTNPRVVTIDSGSSSSSGHIFLRNPDTYQRAAHTLFASSLLNTNKITVNASGVAAQLHRQFPELEVVSVTLPLIGHRPIVYVQPAMPRMMLASSSGNLFVLDANGRALINGAQARHLEKLKVPTVTDQSGLQIDIGHTVLPRSTVSFISQVSAQLVVKNLAVTSYTLPPSTSELDVKINGQPYAVKFNIRDDPKQEVGTFLAVKQLLDSQHKVPGQYIDVRVPGRAFYK
jgi:hypothetical protein